jgi:DNA-binding NtrC family response regulator
MARKKDNQNESENARFVIIAEPGQRMRLTLREILIGQGFLIVGEAGELEETLELCRSRKPSLVILSDQLDKVGFVPIIKLIQAASPGAAIILISDNPSDKALFLASKSETIDILEKPVNRLKLVSMARRMTGDTPVSSSKSNKYYL